MKLSVFDMTSGLSQQYTWLLLHYDASFNCCYKITARSIFQQVHTMYTWRVDAAVEISRCEMKTKERVWKWWSVVGMCSRGCVHKGRPQKFGNF